MACLRLWRPKGPSRLKARGPFGESEPHTVKRCELCCSNSFHSAGSSVAGIECQLPKIYKPKTTTCKMRRQREPHNTSFRVLLKGNQKAHTHHGSPKARHAFHNQRHTTGPLKQDTPFTTKGTHTHTPPVPLNKTRLSQPKAHHQSLKTRHAFHNQRHTTGPLKQDTPFTTKGTPPVP